MEKDETTKKVLQRIEKELRGDVQMGDYRKKLYRGAKFLDLRNELIKERIEAMKTRDDMLEDNEQCLAAYYKGIEDALNHVVKELNNRIYKLTVNDLKNYLDLD